MTKLGINDYLIRVSCWINGSLLMLGLSSRNIGASCFVCFLVIISSIRETYFIMEAKKIKEIHWFCSDWILLAAACAYIQADNFFMKVFFIICMFLCIYLKLYRTCYYEKFSWKHIKKIICDFPLLCLYNAPCFLFVKEPYEIRQKRHKITIGVFLLVILAMGIILPLYTAIDSEIGELAIIILWNCIESIPLGAICILLGLIPAVTNYSIIKGLIEDLVKNNPERNEESLDAPNLHGLFYNEEMLKIVLWGLTVLNILLVSLQINFLLHYQLYMHNIENIYELQGGLPLLLAIIINLFFVSLSSYAVNQNGAKNIKFVTLIYIITLCAMTILLLYRYVLKIINSGINNLNIIGLGCALLLLLIFMLFILSVSKIGVNVWKKAAVVGTIIFLFTALMPVEYIVSNINVSVFLNKYENGEINNVVSEKDIDLAYLGQMEYDSISALAKLSGITLEYEPTKKSVQETTSEILIDYFSVDLSWSEQENLAELETAEKLQQLINILEKKTTYKISGMKETAFNKLKEFQKNYVIE